MIYKLQHISQAVQYILQTIGNAKIICFTAPMGAGKTTLINEICKQLGVTDATSSPTFSIINQYKTIDDAIVYHLDLYRVKDEEEAIQAGVEEVLYSGNYCFVEWPQVAATFMPDGAVNVSIEILNKVERKVIVSIF